MSTGSDTRLVCRGHAWLVRRLIPTLGETYALEVSATFEALYRDARAAPLGRRMRLLAREGWSLLSTAASEARAQRNTRRRALASSGPPPGFSRESRTMLSTWLDNRTHDLRYAVRRLLRTPGFAALAVVIMGLGIGANSAIFSIVNAVLFKPLPFAEPDELVRVFTNERGKETPSAVSYLDFQDYRDGTDLFQGMVAYNSALLSLVTDEGSESIFGESMSWDFFPLMGLTPALGRTFAREEDRPGVVGPVAMLTYPAWQRRYGGDPDVVGQTVRLNGKPVTIIGVGPEAYQGSLVGFTAEFLMPWGTAAALDPNEAMRFERRSGRSLFVTGRLRPGATIDQAKSSLNALARSLAERYPETNADRTVSVLPVNDVRFHPVVDRALYPVAGLLMTVVGLVLVVACTNLANLLLVRASARRKEVAVRLALGAKRTRLVTQLLTESTLLGGLGGIVGLLIAFWIARAIVLFKPPLPIPVAIDLTIDRTVLGFTFLLAVGCGMLFGLAPALRASRPDLVPTLKDELPTVGATRRLSLRNLLVVGQITVSLLLLVTAGLFVRSLRNAQRVDPGFDTSGVAMLRVNLAVTEHQDEASGRVFLDRYLERVAGLPGVTATALTDRVPVDITLSTQNIYIPGYDMPANRDEIEADYAQVSPGYFDVLDVPIVRGRNFGPQDRPGTQRVAIVSEAMARAYWGTTDVVGEQFVLGRDATGTPVEIVGVARDAKVRTLGERPRPYFYEAYSQVYEEFAMIIAATDGDAAVLVEDMRRELRNLDSSVPVFQANTMTQHLGIALFAPRMGAVLLSAFAVLAMLLASLGLYGVVAFAVAQRTREVGIRIALGAQVGEVVRMVLREALGLVVTGILVGTAVAIFATKPLAGLLVDVSPSDPTTFAGVAALLAVVALAASWIPARRAAGIDPITALRYE